ncbi:hypothetical protein [Cesiribacter sp. SM1]|uniref:hypothetical protein n=1 Tax=Cesiribacter sp. SM1 TaxID=2861196 RepID=UPI001CD53084|nr:hypothetical protein [Cesiribacter sp. SM1]
MKLTASFFLAILLLFAGCEKEEPAISQLLEVEFDGKTTTFINEDLSANENCGRIFINASAVTNKFNSSFHISLDITRDGHINSMLLVDYADKNQHYKTANYNAANVFSIRDYSYSPLDKSVTFEFDGTLYEADNPLNTKALKGKVRLQHLYEHPCSYWPEVVKANINSAPFHAVKHTGRGTTSITNRTAYSDDGYRISIVTAREIKEMPVGSYHFAKEDATNRVMLEKYLGSPNANTYEPLWEQEWESYDYEGVLHILEQTADPMPHTSGTFSFKAYQNNKLVYEVTGGKFSL